ncbi:OLC1v1014943C1 [Oldenlandia corymbosa var. corymbosa]|uniref:OLC1v1014943C1 n=1 Tax=Oldenlandia corymbosa var. corymbosa TaxID=529605 RepID=A0AAV1E248_OLDCO|nr:OLC1v1014943C1 [Oldenlandia corymbosa var. corymbosa]
MEMRVRSGGHDFEGSSYISRVPFFVLDMYNFRSIVVDSDSKTAWMGVGLTLGETYYKINEKKTTLACPAGYWPSVGVGGHIGAGGYVILSYKVRLFEVPVRVSGFNVKRTLEQGAIQLVHKWQQISPKMPVKLGLTVQLYSIVNSAESGKKTILTEFITTYRGGINQLLSIMRRYFPELGVTRKDCQEMPWIKSYPFSLGVPIDDNNNLNVKDFLTNRGSLGDPSGFKWKVDFTEDPIPPEGLEKIFSKLHEVPPMTAQLGWTILGGGIMDKIPESRIPFPHRRKLMVMRHVVFWNKNDTSVVAQTRIDWMQQLHRIIGPYVPNNPRAAYAGYRDFELGVNVVENRDQTSDVENARMWGSAYFKNNFDRLVRVKSLVDPQNFLKSEQSIPILQR